MTPAPTLTPAAAARAPAAGPAVPPKPVAGRRALIRAAAAIGFWLALIWVGHRLGSGLYHRDYRVRIGNAPLVGAGDVRLSWRLSAAVAVAAVALLGAPRAAAVLRWRALLVAAWAASGTWAVALAYGDGWAALTAPLQSRYEYLAAVAAARDAPGGFVATFTDVLPVYPTHVKGHPPGLVLALTWLDGLGLGGATVLTVIVLAVGALAAPAVLVAMRATAGEAVARAAAPFLVFAPAAVWTATSADALFTGVAAVGVALVAVAVTPGSAGPGPAEHGFSPRRGGQALVGGVVLGVALHLSYGIAPLGAVVAALLVWRRAWACGILVGAGVLAVTGAFVLAGFFWLDGLQATRELYYAGVASRRPYAEFLVINLAAFAVALGPAAVTGLAGLRDRRLLVLVGGAGVAVLAAELSGMSRGETERIWLPFAPWLLAATAALGARRRWLALQLLVALVVQTTARSPW